MATTVPATSLSLYDLEQKFQLTLTSVAQETWIWTQCTPDFLSSTERQALERIVMNYNNQVRYLPLSEELVKMVVLSPLLDLAGFYSHKFRLVTEDPVEIVLQEEGEMLRGRIDVLIVQDQFWVLAIESKWMQLDVMAALPQLLVYLLSSPPQAVEPLGLLTNGREFVFAQVVRSPSQAPQYTWSDALAINRPQELQRVLATLRTIANQIQPS
jgi:hypothetical protein